MTDPTSDQRGPARPGRTTEEVLEVLDAELSPRDRVRYVLVLLASVTVTGLVATLWATEPALPLRTHVAFGGIVVLGTSWAIVTGYVSSRRRPLYATDRVLATGMATAATTAVGLIATVIAAQRAGAVASATVAVVAATSVGAAIVLHVRARARRRVLLERRRELETALAA